eukprot:jgi/Mesen1/8148/ME000438S07250
MQKPAEPLASGAKLQSAAAEQIADVKPRSALYKFVYSGSKKHVFVGLLITGAVIYAPWYYMTAGKQQSSHQDYMEQAEKARERDRARDARLSRS